MHNTIDGIVIPVWTFGRSGGERVLAKLVNHFYEKGIKTVAVSYYKAADPYFPIECPIMYVDKDGKVREQEKIDGTVKINHYDQHKALLKALNKLSDEYNVAIANYSLTAYAVNKSKIRNKYYYIQAYEAFDEESNGGLKLKIKNAMIRHTYKLPLTRIVNADLYLDYREIKAKYVVPPGLDTSLYYQKSNYWNGIDPFTIGCIGRTEKWKGTDDVGKAVELLQKKGANINFKIAFNPPGYGKYELVAPHGDENLSEYYRSLDVMIAPGTVQLGAVHYPVIESMACGTPVVTTGYYPASPENAYIVPVNAPEKIAETIERIMDNYDEALNKTKTASELIKEFEWERVGDKMLDIIKKTCK